MNFEKLQILEGILGDCVQSKDEYLFFCPFCKHHKRKMSINISKNSYKCWVCDTRNRNIYSLVKRVGDSFHKQKWLNLTNVVEISKFEELFKVQEKEVRLQRIELPFEYMFLAGKNMPKPATAALDYLLDDRELDRSDIFKWKIGYCDKGKYRNRIIIPSFDNDGYCNYFVARSYTGDWMSYKNPPVSKDIIGFELFINWNYPIVIVEGVFDAMSVKRNAIPIFGKTIPKSLKREIVKQRVKDIYISLDRDARKDAVKLTEELMREGINVYFIDLPDKDPSELGFEKFTNIMMSVEPLRFSNLMQLKLGI